MEVSNHRRNRATQILEFFMARLGKRISSAELHGRFGSAFRTRVSELNRTAACPIVIKNQNRFSGDYEESPYWAETKPFKHHCEFTYTEEVT